ncbi:MAG: glycoside hydrolase family 88 protein [Bacteroidales bacterium]|nr:glycoside hydrolase family 88 protein [Candidatus Liminaster caballi]
MKKILTLILTLLAVNMCDAITVHTIGDSTMANKPLKDDNQERGWCQVLSSFFSDDVTIRNYAINGRSSKSFYDEGVWKTVYDQIQPGDYVFIQFGHNDEKIKDAKRGTRPGTPAPARCSEQQSEVTYSYDDMLRLYVRQTLEKGGIPVLFNAIARRSFFQNANAAEEDDLFGKGTTRQKEGTQLVETHIITRSDGTVDDYVNAPRRIANELGIAFVDMNAISKEVIQGYGAEGSKRLFCWIPAGTNKAAPKGREDDTHLCIYGANQMCLATLPAICEAAPALRPYVLKPMGKDEPMSIQMVKSEITRMPEPSMIDYNTQLKWNYTHGLELQSMLQCADRYPNMAATIHDYVNQYLKAVIDADGFIYKYKTTNYSLDHINAGKMLAHAYTLDPQPRYRRALDSLYTQLLSHPRVAEGGFWHKKVYPHQMWLDGIYMGSPYYCQYARMFLEGDTQAAAFNDVVNQIMVIARHTYDPQNGLYRHAWDEAHAQPWCDPATGQAPHVWGRALGWYCMAMVDVLEQLPAGHPGRDSIMSVLQPLCENIRAIQDPEYKAWYQVMDQGQREGNYLETSCTAMFAYTFIKGAMNGWLPQSFMTYGLEAFNGLNKHFIRHDADGTISLTRVCGVAGLGGTPYRSGTFDYYINEIIRDNDPKGVGPYIMTSLLIE